MGLIDKLIHEPARLLLMSYLYFVEKMDFIYLKAETGLSWGNLSSHLSKLESAGYVTIEKTIVLKKTHSMARLTKEGRKAFEQYRVTIDALIKNRI
ncbi:MAG: ArsR family transcriptional regulator [Promethearchaeota archaeon]|nr:MAG: ArsR family transcriptional regulator [Candidatus Lokiarchaeota archaeon]